MAETPADLHAEIEKYERKHSENPDGRNFAPLADAYRKLGELGRAESLLHDGLRRHPEYLSAHIVLGRTLADRGRAAEAASEFRHVLGIDPQNLIALRTLGEMATAVGRADEAGHWYRELLAVDPMNEEARQVLAEIEAPPLGDSSSAAEPDAMPKTASEAEARDTRDEETGDPDLDASPVMAGEEDLAFDAALPGSEPLPAQQADDGPDVKEGMGLELLDWDAEAEPLLQGADELAFPDLADISEGEGEVELVTETIAELYARQGFRERAADMYRELIRRRGEVPEFTRRLAELEMEAEEEDAGARTSAPSDNAFPDSFAFGFAGSPAPTAEEVSASEPAEPAGIAGDVTLSPSFSDEAESPDTGTTAEEPAATEPVSAVPSIGEYFGEILSWRSRSATTTGGEPPLGTDPELVAEAAELATDAATAEDDLFPWERPGSDDAARDPQLAAEEPWSFAGEAFEPEDETAPTASEPRQAGEPQRAVDEPRVDAAGEGGAAGSLGTGEEDDLESFQAWLRSLKR
ncbi:hypothetical protein BH23GEM3_BH23GEM3_01310 [soil metagenome]